MQCILRVDAVLVVPSHTGRIVLFDICCQRLKYIVESIHPFDMLSVSRTGISKTATVSPGQYLTSPYSG